MSLKPGARLGASTSGCEVLVIRMPSSAEQLTCVGAEMATGISGDDQADAVLRVELGKRYHDEVSGLEVLCVKPGAGPLRFGDRELVLREAKALPASD